MFSNGFVQKRIGKEKVGTLLAIYSILFLTLLFIVLMLSQYAGYTFGFRDLRTQQKIDKFSRSSYSVTSIRYNEAFDTESTFIITTTKQHDIIIFGNGMAGEAPLGETTKDTEYHVYYLENDDNVILYCTEYHNDIDFSKGYVMATNNNQDVSSDVVKMFSEVMPNKKPIYVFYEPTNILPVLIICVMIALLLVGTIYALKHSKFAQKHSKLGKNIRKLGDYDLIVKSINEQVNDPIYSSCNCMLLHDYFILFHRNGSDVLINSSVTEVSLEEDDCSDDFFDLKVKCQIGDAEKTYNVYFYTIEDVLLIMDYFNNVT